jgi:uncharacterized protein YegP (UPF0339 family)
MAARIEINKTPTGDYQVLLKAQDGEYLMESYLPYSTKKHAKRAAVRAKKLMAKAEIKKG